MRSIKPCITTYDGIDNAYFDLEKDVLAGKLPYSRHFTTFYDAIAQGFFRRICLMTGQTWSRELEAEFIGQTLPSGWGCGCRYISLSQRQLDAQGLEVSSLKKGDTVEVAMPDGRTESTTLRPDEGWDRPPGQARGARRQELIQRVIDRSPPEIAQQIRADVAAFEARRRAQRTFPPLNREPVDDFVEIFEVK